MTKSSSPKTQTTQDKVNELVFSQITTKPTKIDELERGGYPKLFLQRALFELANAKRIEIDMYSETVRLAR
jgi:hypothetical protein